MVWEGLAVGNIIPVGPIWGPILGLVKPGLLQTLFGTCFRGCFGRVHRYITVGYLSGMGSVFDQKTSFNGQKCKNDTFFTPVLGVWLLFF